MEGPGLEDPLVELEASLTERTVRALPRAGREPVQGDREVMHAQPGHDGLLSAGNPIAFHNRHPNHKIASNILADRLKRLTGAGLLTRDDARPGRRAAHSLTEAAIQPVPVLTELGAWGIRHRVTTPWLRIHAELLASGGPEMQAQFMDELREIHLGHPGRPVTGQRVTEHLASAYSSLSPE